MTATPPAVCQDLTVCVAIDRKTVEQLQIAAPTWLRHHPWLAAIPWVVAYDRTAIWEAEAAEALRSVGKDNARLVAWPESSEAPPYASQRERMLTSFVLIPPRYVQTTWWVKIDTDAVALAPVEWPLAPWFTTPDGPPAIVASPWSYTKPGDQMAALDDWGDRVPELAARPRLNLPYEPGSRRCRHPRIASWLSFYRTDWSRIVAGYAERSCPPDHMPVPSQDGYHFYCAARRGDSVVRTKMKRHGWTNCPRLQTLRNVAAASLSNWATAPK